MQIAQNMVQLLEIWCSWTILNATLSVQKVDPRSEVTYASAMAAVRHGVSPKVLARFLALGLPGGVMMGVDAASFDVTTVMASILGQSCLSCACRMTWHAWSCWYHVLFMQQRMSCP